MISCYTPSYVGNYRNHSFILAYVLFHSYLLSLFLYNQMYIEDCAKKTIFGSFERSKLPKNLNDYTCQLCIEQYAQGPHSQQIKYFKFTPRFGVKAELFTIQIDSISKAKNLIYCYRVEQKEGEKGNEAKIVMDEKVEFKMQTTVKQPPKKEAHLQLLPEPDSDGQLNLPDLDDIFANNNLQLNESLEEDNDSNDSKCVEPPQGVKGNIKNQLIHYFHVQDNRYSKIKEIKHYMRDRGHKISQNGLKSLLGEVCKTNLPDKKVGFVLKDHFFQRDEYERKNPRKRVKEQ